MQTISRDNSVQIRIITITNGNDFSEEMYFDSSLMKDSEAFKEMLCNFDPGDNYTVTFKNSEEV